MMLYNPNVYRVNDNVTNVGRTCGPTHLLVHLCQSNKICLNSENVYAKFGLIPSICSQNIEQIPNSDVN